MDSMARHLAAPVHRTTARIASVGRSPSASSAGGAGFTELEEAFFRAGELAALGDPEAHDFRDLDEPGDAPMQASSRWRSVMRWFRG